MLRKVRLATFLLVGLVLLFSTGALASAAGPTNIDLQHALPITNQQITLPTYSALWFSFYYPGGTPGNRPPVTVTLLNGNAYHLSFKVWTPEQAREMRNEVPIGQGTPPRLNCRISTCPSPDLAYQGAFFTPGTYYVEVFNYTPVAVTATLLMQGSGVTAVAPEQPAVPVPVPTATPSTVGGAALPVTTAGPSNIDLPHALPFINQQITLPGYSALWYSFHYPGGRPGYRPPVMVTLLNGNAYHLSFKVWTPEQAADMTDQVPIGQGTPPKLNCNTSTCPSPDLVYQGAFLTPGAYYVEVFNNSPGAVTVTLMVQGSGVTAGP
jgi:hypothetical protein